MVFGRMSLLTTKDIMVNIKDRFYMLNMCYFEVPEWKAGWSHDSVFIYSVLYITGGYDMSIYAWVSFLLLIKVKTAGAVKQVDIE